MELIDKAAVVAEIKKRLKHNGTRAELDRSAFMAGREQEDQAILTLLDTLEVKEVEEEPSDDLEEEIDKELHENWYGEYIDLDKFRESANHFYELGLKAQKGE